MRELAPMAFHRRLRETLAAHEPGLLRWYSSDDYEAGRADQLRLEILRSSYRLTVEHHERPYRLARTAAVALGLEVDLVLYQLHEGGGANAALCFMPGEAHLLLSGPLLTSLADDELTALFGHELAHYLLFALDDGAYRAVASLIEASAGHASAGAPFVEAALRNRRWTEIYADRGAAIAAGRIEPAIACLVKVGTGLAEVSASDYLAQAREVVARLGGRPETSSHPENAIRAVALELWQAQGDAADAAIATMIEGPAELERLDVVQQRDLEVETRRLLDAVLAPSWMRTETVLTHARVFFPDYAWSPPPVDLALPLAAAVDDYLPYVLLDFATVDPALDEVALSHVLGVARALGKRDALVAVVRKELKLTVATITGLEERAAALLERAARSAEVEA